MSKIFISYRRDDSFSYAQTIYRELVQHFSKDQVFMDVDTVEPGVDFVRVIEGAVGECDILVALIGKRWASVRRGAKSRLDDPNDFVRLEISAALARDIRVIPVLVDGMTMPNEDSLPPPVKPITRRNAIEISNIRFNYDVDQLINAVRDILAATEAKRKAEEEAERNRIEQEAEQRRLEREAQRQAEEEPPEPEAAFQLGPDVVIDFPRSLDDFRGILALRFKIYQTLGYLQPAIQEASSHLDLDPFDSNAIHLLARDMGSREIIGCARLIVPNAMLSAEQRRTINYPAEVKDWCKTVAEQEESRAYRDILKHGPGGQPLPAASMGAYEALRTMLKASHPGLRAEDCCELSRLIVAPKARGQQLSRRLTEAAVQIAVTWLARTIMIIECREHHRVLFERYGFQLTGDIRAERAGQLHAQAITMWRDLKKNNGAPLREQEKQRSEKETKRKAEEENRRRIEEERNRAQQEAEQRRKEAEAQRKLEERLREQERQRSEEEARRKTDEQSRKITTRDHVFICYAREDEAFVLQLGENLKARGVPVWLDQWNIPPGADWDRSIDNAIYDCAKFIIVLSSQAVESREVRGELRIALDKHKPVIPVIHSACQIPRQLLIIQYVDFTSRGPDDEAALKRLLRTLATSTPD